MLLRRSAAAGRSGPWRLVRCIAAGVGVVVVLLAAWVVVPALTADGNDSFAARLAESARDRGLGFAVTGLEQVQYALDPPRDGGSVDATDASALAADAGTAATTPAGTSTSGSTHDRGRAAGPGPAPRRLTGSPSTPRSRSSQVRRCGARACSPHG